MIEKLKFLLACGHFPDREEGAYARDRTPLGSPCMSSPRHGPSSLEEAREGESLSFLICKMRRIAPVMQD